MLAGEDWDAAHATTVVQDISHHVSTLSRLHTHSTAEHSTAFQYTCIFLPPRWDTSRRVGGTNSSDGTLQAWCVLVTSTP